MGVLFLNSGRNSRRAFFSFALLISSRQPSSSLAFTSSRHRPLVRSFHSTTKLDMSKRILVPIGEGSEEIETTCITDTLTRFGAEVTVASVMNGELLCKMSRGIKIMADVTIEDAAKEDWDLIVLPGGLQGAQNLADSKALTALLQKQKSAKKLYGAVCAAPALVLAPQGFLDDSAPATCYPAFRDKLMTPSDDAVVISDNVVTSQGPGTSLMFGLALGEILYGKEKRDEIAKAMLVS